jgi:uncharacterized protein YjfI (DUF2170 family)
VSRIQELNLKLAESNYDGHYFDCLPIAGEQEVLQVLVSDLDELPIFVTITDTQMLCISYLFKKNELDENKINDLNRHLLEMNIPMPLSSFSIVDDYYVIFGALSATSSDEDVMKELVTLAQNGQDAIQSIESYLK